MNKLASERLYIFLCVLFSVLIVVSNIIYQKFVIIGVSPILFEISAGALSYPITFTITDIISEFYTKNHARFCVILGLIMNLIVTIIISIVNKIDATSWSKIDDILFNQVFGFYSASFASSIIACYISQNLDITLYTAIRKITGPNHLWIRNSVSTGLSLLIDTSVVIILMSFSGAISTDYILPLIFDSYSFKLLFVIFNIPLFYIITNIIILINKNN